jgi:hypothetical protein
MLPARFALRAAAESAAAAAAIAAESTATAASTFLRFGFVDRQPASFELLLIECTAGGLRLLVIRHLDKREPARPAGRVVAHEMHGFDGPVLREQLLESGFVGVE